MGNDKLDRLVKHISYNIYCEVTNPIARPIKMSVHEYGPWTFVNNKSYDYSNGRGTSYTFYLPPGKNNLRIEGIYYYDTYKIYSHFYLHNEDKTASFDVKNCYAIAT